ncbi:MULTISPECIES: glycerol-3-phosphate dehydrogenase/oxidase [unclassified Leptolyngbya]|uniref:glycerol-3-phosphate dehydrogenase/oxidase n=1 Tax=unclassified Leptolyngbya TaxID=2650499 RepID=UPI0016851889|nr:MULTISPECIES: glycerol-3-phosphate dehydrogenase/oxidase [unclassified Leptolyngbya]MBD1909087.1 glycerol-3-phosphate dehydrogenase/oxidase [Leptolyngbya sp. FACHB-8]MBD2157002.1 glycerol-3-phosphate dehydrogenase/oxidase [Leptolyngbya sp. FACHB-16]
MTTHLTRENILLTLQQVDEWDVIVIGGGATGLGAAVEAASRGYQTLLLEKYDFAKGTSSRSTKLVHGGVRYLAQGNLALVREALHERGLLHRNAPHLVHNLPLVVPSYAGWSQLYYGAGLKLYDLLSGRLSFGHSQFLNKQKTLEQLPTLNQKKLRGGILYHDGQFDDARLAITLMRTLIDQGGAALNYAPVIGLMKTAGAIAGVFAQDSETLKTFELKAKVVINATGVFVDDVRRMDNASAPTMLSPSQGIHVVVDQRFLPGHCALMIPRTEDERVLFALPWHGKTLIGTTDTPVEQPEYEPRPLDHEIDFILRTIAQYLTPAPGWSDVLSVFVGQRPLVKADNMTSTAALSREHTISVSDSGLVTITGGKWTTYRKMGEDVVNSAVKERKLPQKPSITRDLRLHGWTQTPVAAPLDVYGSDASLIQQMPGAHQLLHPDLPYSEAEIRWAARYEMARTVEDVLSRRTRSLLLNAAASIEAAPRVAAILANELNRDDSWQKEQVSMYQSLAMGYKLNSPQEHHV